jgi:hypothetical protein
LPGLADTILDLSMPSHRGRGRPAAIPMMDAAVENGWGRAQTETAMDDQLARDALGMAAIIERERETSV